MLPAHIVPVGDLGRVEVGFVCPVVLPSVLDRAFKPLEVLREESCDHENFY